MTMATNEQWEIVEFTGGTMPKVLHEIRVKDWSLPLVADHRGAIVAYVMGAYWDDPEAVRVAQEHAELIASAPALKAENEQLKAEVDRLNKKLRRLRAIVDEERGFSDYMVEKYGGAS